MPCAPGLRRRASRRRRWCWGSRCAPHIRILKSVERVPWSGHSSLYAIPEIYDEISKAKMTLIFVNTRSQAEMIFQSLWEANDDNLPIALHHGSLDVASAARSRRPWRKARLRAVVCTSTLELGIDWGDVDLVIHVGAPKGSSRLLQRIGRSNHRLDLPSRGAAGAVQPLRGAGMRGGAAGGARRMRRTREYPMVLKLDVLAQHILGRACAGPFQPDDLYREVTRAWTYRNLTREDFDKAVDYVATGGYALKAYERYAKLKQQADGTLRLSHPRLAMSYRLNIGTIVEDEMLKVRLASVKRRLGKRVVTGGRVLGEMEEWFLSQLTVGRHLPLRGRDAALRRPRRVRRAGLARQRARADDPLLPGRQVSALHLSGRTGARDAGRSEILDGICRRRCRTGCRCSASSPWCRRPRQMLVETFPRADKHYMVVLSLRGPAGAPDAGHAADAAAGALGHAAAGLRRLANMRW